MTETYYGPYKVKGYVGPQTVTLELGPNSKVHPNFSVSKLKPWYGTDKEAPRQLPEPDPATAAADAPSPETKLGDGAELLAGLVCWGGLMLLHLFIGNALKGASPSPRVGARHEF